MNSSRWLDELNIRPETSPLYTSSVYTFKNLDDVRAYYDSESAAQFLYRRNRHPNEIPVERSVAILEKAEAAFLCASGMAAISQACFAHLQPGDHVVATKFLYGGTYAFFANVLAKWGVDVSFIDLSDVAVLAQTIRPTTKLIYAETIANPLLQVTDLKGLGKFAASHNLLLFVDNTFSTPLMIQPTTLGATLSIHSLTKYINGHSDVIGGIVVGDKTHVDKVRQFGVMFGGTFAPFDAWMTDRGLQTLHLRFPAQCGNALRLANDLLGHDAVTRVYYPGLTEDPNHKIAKSEFSHGMYGAMLSFELRGDISVADKFVASLEHVSFAPSLGGIHTTISHPGLTSHRAYSAQERRELGISDTLIRMSVGTEDYQHIARDVFQALDSCR